jgi:hypothetical protein
MKMNKIFDIFKLALKSKLYVKLIYIYIQKYYISDTYCKINKITKNIKNNIKLKNLYKDSKLIVYDIFI